MMKRCPAWWIGIVLVAVCAWVGSAPLGHAQQGTPRMAQQALLPDGASDCSSLGLLFANDIDTGLVRSAANTIGFCAGGALRASLSTSGLTLTTALGVAQGGTGAATFTAGLLRAPGGTTALTSVTSVPDVMTFAPTARTSGSAPFFLITTPADTTLAAAAEAPGILLGGTSAGGTVTRQFSGNDTVALQREIVIPQITYTNSVASKTFTLAASLSLAGVPIKSTNVLGSAAALNIEAGAGSTWTTATGLIVNAPTGATTNVAAQFLGGSPVFIGLGGTAAGFTGGSDTIRVVLSSAPNFRFTTNLFENSINGQIGWTPTNIGDGIDTILTRAGAANLRLGAAAAASPVAQTLSVQNASGTNNAAASTWTLIAPRGTGTGNAGTIVLQAVTTRLASGTTLHTPVTLLTIGNPMSSAIGLTGLVDFPAFTYTDRVTAAAGTIASTALRSVGAGTIAALNAINATDVANLYVASPIQGSNVTATNLWDIWTPGAVRIDGSLRIGNTVNVVNPTSPNRTITINISGTTYYIHAKTTND